MDPYKVLGVSRRASEEEIKRAFRRRAKESHPDRNPGDPHAEERFREIGEAYRLLQEGALPAEEWSLEDVLESIFGGENFRLQEEEYFPDLEGGPDRLRVRLGRDILQRGGTVSIPYEEKELRVRIPPGTKPGSKLRLRGQRFDGGDILLLVETT